MKLLTLFFIMFFYSSFPQTMHVFHPEMLPASDTCLVYIPGDSHNTKPAPALFLLHGWSGNYNQWNEIIDLQNIADETGFIIICPDGLYDSWYLNSPLIKNSQYEDFFFNILFNEVLNSYSIDTSNIFISGLSMGGFGAFNLFLKEPGVFKSAGSTSGVLDISAFPGNWGMNKVLGDSVNHFENYISNSPINRVEKIKSLNKKIIFDCGTEDRIYEVNRKFFEKCRELKIPATFISQPGRHDKEYWKKAIKQHINFFKDLIN